MVNVQGFKAYLDAKGAKMVWCVDYANPLAYHISSELFLTEEDAQAFFDERPNGEGWYKKMYPVEDIWNFTEKQELFKALEEAKAAGNAYLEKYIRRELARDFGWYGN